MNTLVQINPAALLAVHSPSRGFRITLEVAERDASLLGAAATIFSIDNPLRLAHWLGQIAYESAGGALLVEGRSRFVSSGLRYKGRGWTQLTNDFNYEAYRDYLSLANRPDQHIAPFEDVLRYPQRVAELPWAVHSAGWYFGAGAGSPFATRNGQPRGAFNLADSGMSLEISDAITRYVLRPNRDARISSRQARFELSASALRVIEQGGVTFTPCSGAGCLDPIAARREEVRRRADLTFGSLFFKRMSLSAESNLLTAPKVWTFGTERITDLADFMEAIKLLPKPALDRSLPNDKPGGRIWV